MAKECVTSLRLFTIWYFGSKQDLTYILHVFIRLASLGGGPQAHVHIEGKKCRVLYLNLLGMNALFL